jgi:hypothetical protein
MTENNKIDWSKFLPPFPLPDTGAKKFVVGQVWQGHVPGTFGDNGTKAVYRITKTGPGTRMRDHADLEILAGGCSEFVGDDSFLANHSALVPAHLYAEPVKFELPQWNAWPFPGQTGPLVYNPMPPQPLRFDLPTAGPKPEPRPRYLDVVERILRKSKEHKDAGRGDEDFSQVFVPMDDYRALVEFFDDPEPLVWTAIGLVSVHPVNPDGATFSD